MDLGLRGSRALVTGGSRGIGFAIAGALAAEGAAVGIVARGADGEIRAIESPTHRFFIATLFQPQLSSTEKKPHPVVLAFVQAAADWERKKLDDSVLE